MLGADRICPRFVASSAKHILHTCIRNESFMEHVVAFTALQAEAWWVNARDGRSLLFINSCSSVRLALSNQCSTSRGGVCILVVLSADTSYYKVSPFHFFSCFFSPFYLFFAKTLSCWKVKQPKRETCSVGASLFQLFPDLHNSSAKQWGRMWERKEKGRGKCSFAIGQTGILQFILP